MKKRFFRKGTAIFLALAVAAGSSVTSLAAGWQQDETGWWYQQKDGSYPANTWWQDEDGMWYLFDENGYIYSGCYRMVDGILYPFLSNGMWAGTAFADIVPGIWNGNVYTNTWAGTSVTVPEEAVFDYDLDYAMLSGSIVQEFQISIPGSLGANVQMYYQDVSSIPDLTDQQYASVIAISMAKLGMEVSGVETADFNGKTYTKVASDVSGALFADCYFRRVGHYMENFMMIYAVGDEPVISRIVASIR